MENGDVLFFMLVGNFTSISLFWPRFLFGGIRYNSRGGYFSVSLDVVGCYRQRSTFYLLHRTSHRPSPGRQFGSVFDPVDSKCFRSSWRFIRWRIDIFPKSFDFPIRIWLDLRLVTRIYFCTFSTFKSDINDI